MEKAETQSVMSSRDKIRNRLSSRFPDRAFVGQDGNDVQGVIDDSLEEMLAEYETNAENYNSNSKKLTELFARDPRAARVFMSWASGGNLMKDLIETFGDEFRDALDSEEGKQTFVNSHNKWLEKVSENKKAEEEAEANFRESVNTLNQFQQEHNLTDEQTIEVFNKVHQMCVDMVKGIYTAEAFQMALSAINHDGDVAAARAEGEVAGRNARIKEKMRKGADMQLPPSLGGQGKAPAERVPKSKERNMLDTFGLR